MACTAPRVGPGRRGRPSAASPDSGSSASRANCPSGASRRCEPPRACRGYRSAHERAAGCGTKRVDRRPWRSRRCDLSAPRPGDVPGQGQEAERLFVDPIEIGAGAPALPGGERIIGRSEARLQEELLNGGGAAARIPRRPRDGTQARRSSRAALGDRLRAKSPRRTGISSMVFPTPTAQTGTRDTTSLTPAHAARAAPGS